MKEKNRQGKNDSSFGNGISPEEKGKIRQGYSVQEESLHILHVDDDALFLQASRALMILESKNKFEIDTATSVDEALNKLKTHSYDAVVSDYEMPLKNGLDFLTELREQKNSIAFIIFTGKDQEQVAARASNMGADQCINKSGSPQAVYAELVDAIRKIVTARKQARANEKV
jgi:DNA-binding NarL/FixJ family response regulator